MANQIHTLRILVVDDNQDAADMIAEFLVLCGHDAHVAYNGSAAIEVANLIVPHVLFLDLGMPGMSGLDVATTLRGCAALSHIKLVALTAWGDEETRTKVKHAGFDQHLLKPACLDDILKSLS
ncbi:response regulator [Janthinobacterium sp. SUN118]|uniref:response regulator n=1 Tax=Janthinobacterium sp. SUN118 TaxID=3004100 RepID=UPI0025B046C1|nr:response regulator [Janthinobacterium sp. SUN118]MDN2710579.1 response regulator [Janthinobacterium sp. SUN118]